MESDKPTKREIIRMFKKYEDLTEGEKKKRGIFNIAFMGVGVALLYFSLSMPESVDIANPSSLKSCDSESLTYSETRACKANYYRELVKLVNQRIYTLSIERPDTAIDVLDNQVELKKLEEDKRQYIAALQDYL